MLKIAISLDCILQLIYSRWSTNKFSFPRNFNKSKFEIEKQGKKQLPQPFRLMFVLFRKINDAHED